MESDAYLTEELQTVKDALVFTQKNLRNAISGLATVAVKYLEKSVVANQAIMVLSEASMTIQSVLNKF